MNTLHVRKPDIPLEESSLLWSATHEFALFYNGASVVIPIVEYYLNKVIADVRSNYAQNDQELAEELKLFIMQEMTHAKLHQRFNKHMFSSGFDALEPIMQDIADHLEKMRTRQSLDFNAAFCAGFETLATFGAKYLYEMCDQHFDDAESPAANLVLWHVAEEFEHRAVAHHAFQAVSGNYFMRLAGLLYAFYYIPSCFRRCEKVCLSVYWQDKSRLEKISSRLRAHRLFYKQLIYMLPKLGRIMMPGYDPAKLKMPQRMIEALDYYLSDEPIEEKFSFGAP